MGPNNRLSYTAFLEKWVWGLVAAAGGIILLLLPAVWLRCSLDACRYEKYLLEVQLQKQKAERKEVEISAKVRCLEQQMPSRAVVGKQLRDKLQGLKQRLQRLREGKGFSVEELKKLLKEADKLQRELQRKEEGK